MVIFSQSMVDFYARNGIEVPRKMSHKDFKFFLKCCKKAFKGE